MNASIPRTAYRAANSVRKIYWQIAKPETYGVKALVIHPTDIGKILLVRHSYVDTNVLSLPGGGYKPAKESAEAAVHREVGEETGLDLDKGSFIEFATKTTLNEGKIDHITFCGAVALTDQPNCSRELSEARWVQLSPGVLDLQLTAHLDLPLEGYLNHYYRDAA